MSIDQTKESRNYYAIILFVISSIMISQNTLDQTLTIRFVLFAITFTILSFFNKIIEFPPRVFINLFIIHLILTLFSGINAFNKEEFIYDFFKSLFLLNILFFSYSIFKQKKISFNDIFNVSWILSLFIAITCLYQILNLTEWNLYNITGLNGHKNLTSSFILLLLTIKVSYFLFENKNHKTYIILFFILLDLFIIFFLKTRAVWLGISIGIVLFFIYIKFKHFFIGKNILFLSLFLTFALNIIFIFFIYFIINRYDIQKSDLKLSKIEDQERITLWDKTIKMISEKPFLGHGGGNWQINFPKQTLSNIWRAEDLNVTFQRPHNDVLWIISELGILNFEILLFTIILLFSYFFTTKKHIYIYVIIFGIIGFFIAGFFDFPRERSEHSIFIFMLLGFLISKIDNSYFKSIPNRFNILFCYFTKIIFPVTALIFIIRFYSETQIKKIHENISLNNGLEIIESVENSTSIVCSIDSYSVPLRWYSATTYASLGNNKMVLKDLKEAYQKAPYNRHVLNDLGTIYTIMGHTQKAIFYFLKSHKISPRFDEPILNLIVIYINLGDLKKAKYYKTLLKTDSPRREEIENYLNSL